MCSLSILSNAVHIKTLDEQSVVLIVFGIIEIDIYLCNSCLSYLLFTADLTADDSELSCLFTECKRVFF